MSSANLSRRAVVKAGAAAAVAAPALAACGPSAGGGDGGGKTLIRFLYATGDATWNEVVAAVTEAFNAQSENVVVEPEPLPAAADYATALKTIDATGNWPALVDMRDTLTYMEAGKIAPIPESVTALLSDEVYSPAEDGSVYIVPSTALNGEIGFNIVYDKDYFEANGLAVPTTYAEFIALMDAIKANGDVPLAMAAAEVWPSDQIWKPLAAPTFAQYSESGGFWNTVEAGEATIADLREPMERLKTITDEYALEGWQSTQDAQTSTLLVNGQAIMATSSAGLGRLNDIAKVDPDYNAGLFIIPADDGTLNVLKNSVNGETASGIAISKQAQDDGAQYDAAVEFLEYYYSVEACDLMEATGVVSPNIKAAAEVTRNSSIPGAADYFGLLENPKLAWYENEPNNPNHSTFQTFFRQSRIEMMDDQITVDELIEKSQDEFEKNMAEG
ncbi:MULTISPECIES: ABC transporter substrate-binding protein [Glycomyces]|uniref:Extracellular solute-binding protein n=2 Tax=Glycomyces TaxID=58113 RepID=A0A9X3ST61_9ACTN|nr:extracellular solute-binding protein [Glycomyces lechevalierae]MDA1383880.1 extracellular solute-binding protein [Glycomyces lechevalierae]MDR7341128.1 raffinose/stachyose/melibiose transport system substrate-binding protein [Glycomyces lechevalierae]